VPEDRVFTPTSGNRVTARMMESREAPGDGSVRSFPHCRIHPLFEAHAVLDRAVVDDETLPVIGQVGDS